MSDIRFTFGKGENLIIATNGLQGSAMRMTAASYLTSGEARQRIIDEVQPREVGTERMRIHGRNRALFVYNMHRPSSNILDVIFDKKKPHGKNKSTHRNRSNAHRVPAV
jgi:hypothetical protein